MNNHNKRRAAAPEKGASRAARRKSLAGGLPSLPRTSQIAAADAFIGLLRQNVKDVDMPPAGILQAVLGDKVGVEILQLKLSSARAETRQLRAENQQLRESKQMAWRMAPCRYLVGGKPVRLSEPQDEVIEALLELGGNAMLDELRERSGRQGPDKILRTIVAKHPELASFIRIPGEKGRGGYSTTIRTHPR